MRALLVGTAIVAVGAMTSSPGYPSHCEGGGDWCHPTGDCDWGSGGEGDPVREHNHESGGPGCTGLIGNYGSCTGEHGGMDWKISCHPGLRGYPGVCWMTLNCPGGTTHSPTQQGIRCDNSSCIIRANNACHVRTCSGSQEISCSGLGL